MKTDLDPARDMANRRFRAIVAGFFGILVHALFRLDYQGLENLPSGGPLILVSNHTSMADLPAIQTIVRPWVYWVAKKELFEKPVFRSFYTRLGCIPVDRRNTDLHAARAIIRNLHENHIVGMFPQGTRVKAKNLPTVVPRSGAIHFALKTGTPLLPIAIDGPFKLFRRVRIVIGPPFKLERDPEKHYSAEELDQMAVDLMKHIYAMIGIDYQLADPKGVKKG